VSRNKKPIQHCLQPLKNRALTELIDKVEKSGKVAGKKAQMHKSKTSAQAEG
jgi:hypothetical protein